MPSETLNVLSRVFSVPDVGWPPAGPTDGPPEGPSKAISTTTKSVGITPSITEGPPAEPAEEPKQSTVSVTVGPREVKAVELGTAPPDILGRTTTKIAMPGTLPASYTFAPRTVSVEGTVTVGVPPTAAGKDVYSAPFVE